MKMPRLLVVVLISLSLSACGKKAEFPATKSLSTMTAINLTPVQYKAKLSVVFDTIMSVSLAQILNRYIIANDYQVSRHSGLSAAASLKALNAKHEDDTTEKSYQNKLREIDSLLCDLSNPPIEYAQIYKHVQRLFDTAQGLQYFGRAWPKVVAPAEPTNSELLLDEMVEVSKSLRADGKAMRRGFTK